MGSGCFVGMRFIKMVSFHITAGIVLNELVEARFILACRQSRHSSFCNINNSSIMVLTYEFLVLFKLVLSATL